MFSRTNEINAGGFLEDDNRAGCQCYRDGDKSGRKR